MSTAVLELLDELKRANDAAFALARELAAARGDADEWTRFPSPKSRCPISGFSRSKIVRLAEAGTIRRKSVGSSAFYSGADLRRHLSA